MNTMTLTRGFPGSGKTTWAVEHCRKTDAANINRDDIRRTLGIGQIGDNSQENSVTEVQAAMVDAAINNSSDIVLSDTNLRPKNFRRFITTALDAGYDVQFKDFIVDLDEVLRRNSNREEDKVVPEDVIRTMWKKFPYSQWKDVDEVMAAGNTAEFDPIDNDDTLPHCVLVDVDGTLAHHNDERSPYDWSKVSNDTVDNSVRHAVKDIHAAGVRVVIMSGRDAVCHDDTVAWLKDHDIPFDEIHMRVQNDNRADYIVKDELVRTHIEGKFHIRYCLDDRQQVVDHYRKIGLKVFQVQPGDF